MQLQKYAGVMHRILIKYPPLYIICESQGGAVLIQKQVEANTKICITEH